MSELRERVRVWVGDRAFYKMVLAVFLPIMLQQGITQFVGLLDNIMVGQVGTEQMSGVSIVNQLMLIFNLCLFGGFSGIGIFGAQFFGQNNDEGVRYTMRMKVWLSIILTVLFTLIFLVGGTGLISAFLSEEGEQVGDLEVTLHYGKRYLWVMLFSMLPFAVSQMYASTLREAKVTVLPMVAGLIAVVVNLVFNWIFIFGNLGCPKMGCEGAALATVISRIVECVIIVAETVRRKKQLPFHRGLYRSLRVPAEMARRVTVTAFPLLFNECLWSLGATVLVGLYAQRGLAAVAAMNISNTVNNVFAVFYQSAGNAIGIIVGQLLGAGLIAKARDVDRKLIFFSMAGSLALSGMLAIAAPLIPLLYNTEWQVQQLATRLLFMVALTTPIMSFCTASYFTIRCGGKTWLTFFFDCGFSWIVEITLAFVLIHYTGADVVQCFFLVQASEIIKCIIGGILIHKGGWANNVVNDLDTSDADEE